MTKAQLLLSDVAARPGQTVWAGVRLEMGEGWHTYWRNPGEAGKSTTIEWVLPKGVTAGQVLWPAPEVHVSGGITTFVYHRETILLTPLNLTDQVPAGDFHVRAKINWLECKEVCVPGSAEVQARLTVSAAPGPSAHGPLLELWRRRIPLTNPKLEATATWEGPADTNQRFLIIEGVCHDGFAPSDFLPYESASFEVNPTVEPLPAAPGKFRLRKEVKRLEQGFPGRLAGIVLEPGKEGKAPVAFEVELKPREPRSSPSSDTGGAGLSGLRAGGDSARGLALLLGMLGLAFLGGLILNIMPCVLPVIALKILGFVRQSKEAPEQVRKLGLVYCAGVLASFISLAVIVITVRQTGGSVTWGIQMQNPHFRLGLLLVVILVALNLLGVFEVTLGSRVIGAAAAKAPREGLAGAFFNGVLATALATPCTAPFLTVALGFAFTQPAGVILLMFVTTAAGLATPYFLLSWQPGWLRFLPKPGPWMAHFKTVMAFPMLATGVWLFDLTAPSFGEGGPLWLGLFLVVLALVAWIWGQFVQQAVTRRGLARAISLGLLAVSYFWVLEGQLHWRSPSPGSRPLEILKGAPDSIPWQRWSAEAVDAARAAGHPVLVDFTAKWCLTCKSNKKLALETQSVRARLKQVGAVAFLADNTDLDPAIATELKRYGRAGVPLVLVFPADRRQPATVLPALLTPGIVLAALDKATQ
jgi:thiol:disulfide interchange protein DsbD